MEFKNKISTSIEQLKMLLEWGLKPETADMKIPYSDKLTCSCGYKLSWSLSWLIELMPENIIGKNHRIFYYPYFNIVDNIFFYYDDVSRIILHQAKGSTPFDASLNMIDYLIKNNYFNKEYLNK